MARTADDVGRREAEADLFEAYFSGPEEWLALLERMRRRAVSSADDKLLFRKAVHTLAGTPGVDADAVLTQLYEKETK